jgi:hypothetical protein
VGAYLTVYKNISRSFSVSLASQKLGLHVFLVFSHLSSRGVRRSAITFAVGIMPRIQIALRIPGSLPSVNSKVSGFLFLPVCPGMSPILLK